MTKLIIQIPCYNEEATLGATLSKLPREIPNVDCIEWLVINDGSVDRTTEVAKDYGVDYIVSFSRNQGLAKAFMLGIETCLKAGANIIVNTDADNQYCANDIPKLIEPIISGKAEIVIGARSIDDIESFSRGKKFLQKIGSRVVRIASSSNVLDAPSGFRALSREAAMRLNVFSEYTYTLETIIQAGQRNVPIASVPVQTNECLRPSRLSKSSIHYINRSILTIFRIFLTYRPLRFFIILGSVPFVIGLLAGIRWAVLALGNHPTSHLPSLIIASILVLMALQLWVFGLVAHLLAVNRKMLEDIQLRLRRFEYNDRRDFQT